MFSYLVALIIKILVKIKKIFMVLNLNKLFDNK